MVFKDRLPQVGLENRKFVKIVSGSASDGEFYAKITNADGAEEEPDSVLCASNLNNLTVKAANITGTVGDSQISSVSAGKLTGTIDAARLPASVTAQVTVTGGSGIGVSKSGSTYTVSGNYASQSVRGMIRMYVSGSTLYLYNQ